MKTSVLGIRLSDEQRERLDAVCTLRKCKPVDLLMEAVDGKQRKVGFSAPAAQVTDQPRAEAVPTWRSRMENPVPRQPSEPTPIVQHHHPRCTCSRCRPNR